MQTLRVCRCMTFDFKFWGWSRKKKGSGSDSKKKKGSSPTSEKKKEWQVGQGKKKWARYQKRKKRKLSPLEERERLEIFLRRCRGGFAFKTFCPTTSLLILHNLISTIFYVSLALVCIWFSTTSIIIFGHHVHKLSPPNINNEYYSFTRQGISQNFIRVSHFPLQK